MYSQPPPIRWPTARRIAAWARVLAADWGLPPAQAVVEAAQLANLLTRQARYRRLRLDQAAAARPTRGRRGQNLPTRSAGDRLGKRASFSQKMI